MSKSHEDIEIEFSRLIHPDVDAMRRGERFLSSLDGLDIRCENGVTIVEFPDIDYKTEVLSNGETV